MNDMAKSYYEIASEEFNKSKGAADAARGTKERPQDKADAVPDKQGTADPTKEIVAQLTAILAEQGIQPGTPEFDKWLMDAMGQGDDPEDVASEEEEMMDAEQAIQSKMMKEK